MNATSMSLRTERLGLVYRPKKSKTSGNRVRSGFSILDIDSAKHRRWVKSSNRAGKLYRELTIHQARRQLAAQHLPNT
ncbi:hypothetical protein NE850_24640 [Paraburkholderia sp. USG1]|uniref:hypothetical protein n=1 Tax=Paraburkholderia sp. USG1 TaxID=2952268 RepID=UPI002857F952|nr:hypothetical protein [Paraburkholderia sp. USG1]MDR8399502.1 hypothetical protein [Paraburkholderia sp. USG1]